MGPIDWERELCDLLDRLKESEDDYDIREEIINQVESWILLAYDFGKRQDW